MQYRSMNVDHLQDDEIEHELNIRLITCGSDDKRDAKKRKLRRAIKDESVKVVLITDPVQCASEADAVDRKLALIRDRLENQNPKKVELPAFKTRLIHLYFRVMRLKEYIDTDGLENSALKMLNENFSMFSSNPNTSKREKKATRKALEKLKKKGDKVFTGNSESSDDSDEEDSDEKDSDEKDSDEGDSDERDSDEDDSENEKESSDDTVRANRNTGTSKQVKRKPKRNKKKVGVLSARTVKMLMKHMESMIEQKLSRLDLGKNSKSVKHTANPVKDKRSKPDKKQRTKPEKEKNKRKPTDDSSEDSEVTESSDEDVARTLRRRPRSVADWKVKYDGKDEGKKLNRFIAEVEFMAEAEQISRRDLFNEAIHLFTGDARTWYMEGKNNGDFRKWSELVTELKLEFQPPDMDYNYEQQAAQRRQKRSEKFQDFYNAEMEIFRFMAVPPSEQRKFEIIFRNLRSDYKNVLAVRRVRTLKALKRWGKILDSANSWMYRTKDSEPAPKSAHVHEVSRDPSQKYNKPETRPWKAADSGTKPNWKGTQGSNKPPAFRPPTQERNENQGSSAGTLEKRVQNYRVPDKMVCFNCRGRNHHFEVCMMPKEVFCTVCGFHDYPKEKCPFCLKNGRTSV